MISSDGVAVSDTEALTERDVDVVSDGVDSSVLE